MKSTVLSKVFSALVVLVLVASHGATLARDWHSQQEVDEAQAENKRRFTELMRRAETFEYQTERTSLPWKINWPKLNRWCNGIVDILNRDRTHIRIVEPNVILARDGGAGFEKKLLEAFPKCLPPNWTSEDVDIAVCRMRAAHIDARKEQECGPQGRGEARMLNESQRSLLNLITSARVSNSIFRLRTDVYFFSPSVWSWFLIQDVKSNTADGRIRIQTTYGGSRCGDNPPMTIGYPAGNWFVEGHPDPLHGGSLLEIAGTYITTEFGIYGRNVELARNEWGGKRWGRPGQGFLIFNGPGYNLLDSTVTPRWTEKKPIPTSSQDYQFGEVVERPYGTSLTSADFFDACIINFDLNP